MRLRFRNLFWSGAGLVILALMIFAFWPRPVLVDMADVVRGPMSVAVRDEGRTRVRDVYVVSAPVAGRLLRVERESGDAVDTGETVARLLPSEPALLDARSESEARAAVRLAEAAQSFSRAEAASALAALNFALAEFNRIEALHTGGVASQGALDRVRLDLRRAQAAYNTAQAGVRMRDAELEAAQARLQPDHVDGESEVMEIAAPIGGLVLQVLQESESPVAAGAPLLEIGNPADLEIVVELLSTDAVQVRDGAAALISDWGDGARPLRGRVRRVEPYGFLKISALGVEEQRVNVIVDLVDPPEDWQRLGHGFRVEAAIETWSGEDVLQVPVPALFRHEGGWALFVVEGGRARLTPVEVGHDNGEVAEILSGLTGGETVVLYPGETVSDGIGVTAR